MSRRTGAPIRRRFSRAVVAAATLGATAAGTVDAQSVSLDEGVFDIYLDGERVGTERFSIRRAGAGAGARVIAQATIRLEPPGGTREMVVALEAEARTLRPSAYQIKISGTERVEITGQLLGHRFSAKVVSAEGEEAREYRASPDALIVDRSVAHQYYFLARRLENGQLSAPVIVPRRGTQITMEVARLGREEIALGGVRIEAHRLRVTAGEGDIRHLWVDGSGRVVRLEAPALDYRARRRAPPP